MIVSNHLCIGILVVSISALGVIACGSTVSNSGGSAELERHRGRRQHRRNGETGGGSAANGGGGDGTAGTGGSTTGASGGSSSGGTAGTGGSSGGSTAGTGGAGGGSGGSGGAPETPLYLVSIDHWANPSVLRKIDITTGIGKVVCALPSGVDGVDDVNYHSSTFSRDGILFASNAKIGWIDKIDPCSCAVEHVGPTGFGSIPGITANKRQRALRHRDHATDVLLDINPMTGAGTGSLAPRRGFRELRGDVERRAERRSRRDLRHQRRRQQALHDQSTP